MTDQKPLQPNSPVPPTVHRGILIGYRRFGTKAPSVVLPVFVDADDRKNTLLLYQNVGDNDTVLSFVGDPQLSLQHIVPVTANGDPVIVEISSPPIHAYEVRIGTVILAPLTQFRIHLRRMLDDNCFSEWPFAALEIARFVNDSAAEETYASRCASKLMARSPALAASWVAGTALSLASRDAANGIIGYTTGRGRKPVTLDVRDAYHDAAQKQDTDINKPGGLEWLKKAKPDHPSWARMWREIWGSAAPNPTGRREHAERAHQWLQVVNPNHEGWASVWGKLWEFTDTENRGQLKQYADRWLKEVEPNHYRWAFVWLNLLNNSSDDPRICGDLFERAVRWLATAQEVTPGWTEVWQKVWQLDTGGTEHHAFLFTRATEWLDHGDRRRKFWFEVWNLLWNISNAQERDALAEKGYQWLDQGVPNKPAWLRMWQLLWDAAENNDVVRDRLANRAETWLSKLNHNRTIWARIWETLWDAESNDRNRRETLRRQADRWLTDLSGSNRHWARVWQLLWDDGLHDPDRQAELSALGQKWLSAVSPGDSQREIILRRVRSETGTSRDQDHLLEGQN